MHFDKLMSADDQLYFPVCKKPNTQTFIETVLVSFSHTNSFGKKHQDRKNILRISEHIHTS